MAEATNYHHLTNARSGSSILVTNTEDHPITVNLYFEGPFGEPREDWAPDQTFDVPAGETIEEKLSGGSGEADLYAGGRVTVDLGSSGTRTPATDSTGSEVATSLS